MKTGYENKMRKPAENKCERRVFKPEEVCKLLRVKPSELRDMKSSKKKK